MKMLKILNFVKMLNFDTYLKVNNIAFLTLLKAADLLGVVRLNLCYIFLKSPIIWCNTCNKLLINLQLV